MQPKRTAFVACLATLGLAAPGVAATPTTRPLHRPAPAGRASSFTPVVTNRWLPLRPGMRWEYRGAKDGRRMREIVRVTPHVERVAGVPCATVDDRAWLDGRLAERTTDWYTQDSHGTVWYYGERTAELDRRGRVVSREGSWRAGVAGARAGVFMPAAPRVGATFAQEHLPGHAEDHFRVVSRHASVTVPFRTFRGTALETREWTPIEPGVRDGKWYAAGVGVVREATIRGPVEHAELVAFHR